LKDAAASVQVAWGERVCAVLARDLTVAPRIASAGNCLLDNVLTTHGLSASARVVMAGLSAHSGRLHLWLRCATDCSTAWLGRNQRRFEKAEFKSLICKRGANIGMPEPWSLAVVGMGLPGIAASRRQPRAVA